MGKRPTGEVSVRGFHIFGFGWRVAVFSVAVRSSELYSVVIFLVLIISVWYYPMRLRSIWAGDNALV